MAQVRPLPLKQWARQLTETMDHWVTHLAVSDSQQVVDLGMRHMEKRHEEHTKLLNPEEEVKQLINSAVHLDDIWDFFSRRLQNGSPVDFMCFSIVDDSGDFIRIPYVSPAIGDDHGPEAPIFLSMDETQNHLVQAYLRKDTTFTAKASTLGSVLSPWMEHIGHGHPDRERLNLFSIPFIAANRAIALITLGFFEIDAFSQAKLSYIYTLRDQIAQLVWNLVLQERMNHQAQMDNLTGLMSHGSFQRVLDQELRRADEMEIPLSFMLLDLNNLQEINNQQGHQKGDEAIQYLASTVRRLIRGLDTVARFGGDEVVVLLPEIDGVLADQVAHRFIQGFQERLPADLKHLSISIGHSTFPHDTRNRDELVALAEQAIHLAKFRGSKTGESTLIASREVDKLNEKTILEVFASYVARKYNHQPSNLFNNLIRHAQQQAAELNDSSTLSLEANTEHLKLETIRSLAGALEAKDRYTRGHSQAVSNYAVALAHALKLGQEEVEQIRVAAFLHDIGKIGIPESILCKAGPLDDHETEIMKQHPVIGARQILSPVSSLKHIIPMVEHHHERWDGGGHPAGLAGEAIPLGARIISVVDAFHALTSDRPYRAAMSITEARTILQEGGGSQWDPHIVEIFMKLLEYAAPRQRQGKADEAPAELHPQPPHTMSQEAPTSGEHLPQEQDYQEATEGFTPIHYSHSVIEDMEEGPQEWPAEGSLMEPDHSYSIDEFNLPLRPEHPGHHHPDDTMDIRD